LVGVFVGVGVQERTLTLLVVLPDTGRLLPVSVALAATLSWKMMSCDGSQGGAVSCTLPVQVSVAPPLGPRVVTGLPPWEHWTATAVPPGKGTVLVTARLMTLNAGSRF